MNSEKKKKDTLDAKYLETFTQNTQARMCVTKIRKERKAI